MTQPTLPTAAGQKQAAAEVFAQYEPPLYEAYLDMMLEWLAAVKTAMFAGGVVRLGLIPDPLTVFSQTPKWAALTSQYTEQVARDVLAAPYKDLFADGTLFESRPFVRNWIAARENRLSAVPTEVYGAVAQIIDSATVNGASIPDVTAQVEQLFGDTSIPKWKNRARTVARTEVVGAYNGGLHDAFTLIAQNDPGTAWVKRWLATEDNRTRPDHVEADGQVVPFAVPFIVGGYQMMHPHDPDGPAKEVINCRCVELLEMSDEPTDMGNRQYLGASFDPAEKRDKNGKWLKGGGLLKSLLKKSEKSEPVAEHLPKPHESTGPPSIKVTGPPSVKVTGAPSAGERRTAGGSPIIGKPEGWKSPKDPALAARFDAAASGADTLAEMKAIDSLSPAQALYVGEYGMAAYESLNASLGKGVALSGKDKALVEVIDSALPPGARKKDVIVWRGMRNPDAKFGKAWNKKDVTGLEWTQKGFSSTSADFGIAAGFAKEKDGKMPVVMRVLIPKDAKIGTLDMRGRSNSNSHESEALLSRGVRYRVVADHGVGGGINKIRYLDVEVVS